MDWLTKYLDIIIPAALVLLYLFQRAFLGHEEEGQPPGTPEDSEARRIQEEIRRKIIERQQGRTQEQPPEQQRQEAFFPQREHPPVREDRPFHRAQPPPLRREVREPPITVRAEEPYRDLEEELRIQREKVLEARRAREQAVATAGARAAKGRTGMRPARQRTGELREDLLDDLRDAESLRRAFVLKEVLDRPVALRDQPASFTNWA